MLSKNLALLLPAYKSLAPQTAVSLMRLFNPKTMELFHRQGDAFIVHTRNRLANQFVESGIEWSLWLDDDMIFPFGDAKEFKRLAGFEHGRVNLIERLMSHQKEIIGGLYFGRNEKRDPMYNEGIIDPQERMLAHGAPLDIIRPTAWVATGALLVHRQVYLDIQARFPMLAPQDEADGWHYFSRSETELVRACELVLQVVSNENNPLQGRVAKTKELLEGVMERLLSQRSLTEGEDITFCKRAMKAGHQPYVDLGAVCGHIGQCVYGPSP